MNSLSDPNHPLSPSCSLSCCQSTSSVLLALLLVSFERANAGLFSRITMTSMTSKWYLKLSHFEALLVGLVVLNLIVRKMGSSSNSGYLYYLNWFVQVFVMRYFLILPLDITKLIEDGTLLGTSVSRKRRDLWSTGGVNLTRRQVSSQQRLAESMFTVIRRLDEYDCVLRTLCELEANRAAPTPGMPNRNASGVTYLLETLKKLGHQRLRDEEMATPNNVTIRERKVLSEFEDAVLFGSNIRNSNSVQPDDFDQDLNHNSTSPKNDRSYDCENEIMGESDSCAVQFSLCAVDKYELLHYASKIEPFLIH